MYIQTPASPATEFILREEGGIILTLKDRFLPYRPLRIEGRQRAEFTWYPGSPEATVQMLGPEEGTIRLSGFWKDKFFEVFQNAYAFPVDPLAAAGPPAITNVAELVATVDNMRRMGRQITLAWSGLERVGHIISFAHTWHNIHDCEWEIEFAVLSQGEATVPSAPAANITIPDAYTIAYQQALKIQDQIQRKLGLPEWVAATTQVSLAFEGAQLLISATAGTIGDVARSYANGVLSVTQGARRTVSTLTGAISGLKTQAETIGYTATAEAYSFGIFGDMDNAPAGVQIAAASYQRESYSVFRNARYEFASRRRAMAQVASEDAARVKTYIPTKNTDLRDISTQSYGNGTLWTQLMQYNNLTSSEVPTGKPIAIPPASVLLGSSNVKGG